MTDNTQQQTPNLEKRIVNRNDNNSVSSQESKENIERLVIIV